MEEQKTAASQPAHPADCGCEVCYKKRKSAKTKRIVINIVVLVVVFVLGILIGRAGSGPSVMTSPRGNYQDFQQGTMRSSNRSTTGNQTSGQQPSGNTQTQQAPTTQTAPATTQP